MKISKEKKSKLTESLIETFDLRSLDQERTKELLLWGEDELDDLLELNSEKIKQQRFDFFKIPNTTKDDFSEQLYQVDDSKNVLAGIRHAGGNVEIPFIHITPDFQISSLEELKKIKEKILPSLEKFSPLFIDCWVNPTWSIHSDLLKRAEPRQRYIVGKISKILEENKAVRLESNFSIERVEDKNFYHWYKEIYDEFHSSRPELKDWVPINQEEDMIESMQNGLLWYILDQDKKIGIIQGEEESLLGEPSLYISEILLTRDYKGRGLAPLAQVEFIKENASYFKFVWGTIDQKNIPSMKTALRVGRSNIRSAFMLPIDIV